jgi:hypothetical protein
MMLRWRAACMVSGVARSSGLFSSFVVHMLYILYIHSRNIYNCDITIISRPHSEYARCTTQGL